MFTPPCAHELVRAIQPFREKGCLLELLVHRLCAWSVRKPQCLRASSAASPVAVTAKQLTPFEISCGGSPRRAFARPLRALNFHLADYTRRQEKAVTDFRPIPAD